LFGVVLDIGAILIVVLLVLGVLGGEFVDLLEVLVPSENILP
jgi:hypothetical protein